MSNVKGRKDKAKLQDNKAYQTEVGSQSETLPKSLHFKKRDMLLISYFVKYVCYNFRGNHLKSGNRIQNFQVSLGNKRIEVRK